MQSHLRRKCFFGSIAWGGVNIGGSSMKNDSKEQFLRVETCSEEGRPCAGGMPKNDGVSRRLRSLKDGRVKVSMPSANPLKTFDPTAWYVAAVKRHSELKCRDMLNGPNLVDFPVEAYVATQVLLRRKTATAEGVQPVKEKVVIPGKIFIRVSDKSHRIPLLKACPYLTHFIKDASLLRTENNFTDFARIPDKQIQCLKAFLQLADGPVAYVDEVPRVHDAIKVVSGPLSKNPLFKDLVGTVEQVNGKTHVTIVLDHIGSFRFVVPITTIAKVNG